MRRTALVVSLVVLLLVPSMAATPVGAAPQHDETVIGIEIQSNGDAVWTVSMRYNLTDENETAAFERIRSEYEAGTTDAGPSADLFREAAAQVAAESGREMEITSVSRSSSLEVENDTQVGVLELSFRWTNFATVEGEQISVRTAFTGGWFGDLSADQTLSIEPPSGYRVQTASPSTDIIGGALQWEGPQTFSQGEPAVEFRPPSTSTPPTTTPPQNGIPWTYAAIAFTGLVFGGLVLLAWQGGYLGGPGSSSDDDSPPGGGVESESQAAPGVSEGSPESTTGAVDASESDGSETGAERAGEPVDMDLLSDEERVEHILDQHGGRMKQAQIVEETRWSNAKVSQLLSSMAEEGRVEKLRIGRENLISLPDHDIEE